MRERTLRRRWIMRRAIWVVAGLLAAAGPVLGQGGPPVRGARGGGLGPGAPGVERNLAVALERADELGLDEDQVLELQAMRDELAALRQRRADVLSELPGRYEGALTEAQRTQVRALVRGDVSRARPGRAGFRGTRNGGLVRTRGVRPRGGWVPGIRARMQANRVRVRADRIPARAGRILPRAMRIRRGLPPDPAPVRRTGPGVPRGGGGSGPASGRGTGRAGARRTSGPRAG